MVSKEAHQCDDASSGTVGGQLSATDATAEAQQNPTAQPWRWKMWLLVTQLMHSMCGEGRFDAMQFRYLLNLEEQACLDYTTSFLIRRLPFSAFQAWMIACITEAMNLYMTERCLQRVRRKDVLRVHLHLRVTGITHQMNQLRN